MTSPLRNLAKVEVYVSLVLSSDVEETWQLARDFGNAPWWNKAGVGEFEVHRMKGKSPAELGSGRVFYVGKGRLFEKLTALDDNKHKMSWMVVSHPQTISPFGHASFLNYTSKLRLWPVTITKQTFAEWRGSFLTEAQHADVMEGMIANWYYAGLLALQKCAALKSASEADTNLAHSSSTSQPVRVDSYGRMPIVPSGFEPDFLGAPQHQGIWSNERLNVRTQGQAASSDYWSRSSDAHPLGSSAAPSSPKTASIHNSRLVAATSSDSSHSSHAGFAQHFNNQLHHRPAYSSGLSTTAEEPRLLYPRNPYTAPNPKDTHLQPFIHQIHLNPANSQPEWPALERNSIPAQNMSSKVVDCSRALSADAGFLNGVPLKSSSRSRAIPRDLRSSKSHSNNSQGQQHGGQTRGAGRQSDVPTNAQRDHQAFASRLGRSNSRMSDSGHRLSSLSSLPSFEEAPSLRLTDSQGARMGDSPQSVDGSWRTRKGGSIEASVSSAWAPPIPRVSSAADLQTSRNVKLEALALHSSQSARLSAQNLSRGHSTASHSSSEKQKASVQNHSNPGTPSEGCEQRHQTQAWSDSMYGSGKESSDDDPSSPKRSSLDEQVASLQERHQLMHNAANSGQVCASPFASPFHNDQHFVFA